MGRNKGQDQKATNEFDIPTFEDEQRGDESDRSVDITNPAFESEILPNPNFDPSPSEDAAFDSEDHPQTPRELAGRDKTTDDWGSLGLGGIARGDVDEFILNWCKNACASKWLELSILGCILFNTFLLAYAGPANVLHEDTLFFMMVADLVLTTIFTAEMLVRIIAVGFYDRKGLEPVPRYLNDDWNKMDFFVVISSWVNVIVEVTGFELGVSMSSLRALRIMRVLKAFKSIEGIRIILATIAAALPHTINVVFFMMFMFVVSGIIGVQMFRGLTRRRCEWSSFDLMAQLETDRFPMVEGPFPWDTDNGTIEISAATVANTSAPGPFPADIEPTWEYPIGIGMWATYCTVDEDCPLFQMSDPWNRTQTCQTSLNPGKGFSSYDSAPEAWLMLFVNMASQC